MVNICYGSVFFFFYLISFFIHVIFSIFAILFYSYPYFLDEFTIVLPKAALLFVQNAPYLRNSFEHSKGRNSGIPTYM